FGAGAGRDFGDTSRPRIDYDPAVEMAEASEEQSARIKRMIAERRYDEAIRESRRALLTKPDLVELRLLLGQALLATGRYEQVRVEMMALSRRHPNVAESHRILGEAQL